MSQPTKIQALVDYARIRLTTHALFDHETVRKALRKVLGRNLTAIPIHPDPNGLATQFEFNFQEPSSKREIDEAVNSLSRELQNDFSYEITCTEVAVDFYAPSGLANIAAQLYSKLTRYPSDNRRIYKSTAKRVPAVEHLLKEAIEDGWQIAIGSKSDSVFIHIYLKVDDQRGNKRIPVQPRARIEINLKEDALSLIGGDWKFSRLTQYFNWREPENQPTDKQIERMMALSEDREQQIDWREQEPAHAWNEAVRLALVNLGRRWKSVAGRGRPKVEK